MSLSEELTERLLKKVLPIIYFFSPYLKYRFSAEELETALLRLKTLNLKPEKFKNEVKDLPKSLTRVHFAILALVAS